MRSNNPVFNRSEEFSNAYGNRVYSGAGTTYADYGQAPGQTAYAPTTVATGERMTVDTVVQTTAVALLTVIIGAVAGWLLTPKIGDFMSSADLSRLQLVMYASAGIAFVLSLVNSFKRVISPALVIAFCAAEGVALGVTSKFFDAVYGGGVVVQAVVGTFAAFAGTLAAYKFFHIRVGSKFRTFTIAAVFGMVGLGLMELVLGMFGSSFGLFAVSGLGMVTAVIGLVLGVFMLILDFDFVEQGVANGLPERESWRAAFGLTVSLVWIYLNLLRILAFIQRR